MNQKLLLSRKNKVTSHLKNSKLPKILMYSTYKYKELNKFVFIFSWINISINFDKIQSIYNEKLKAFCTKTLKALFTKN